MVCQAASQTRFRALKHENGIAGRTTIIVRVIACFQPLQNCQAEYFRHLLKPVTMFTAKDSQTYRQLSAQKLPDFDRMARGQLEQNYGLPYLRASEFFKLQPPHWTIPYPTENFGLRNSQNALPRGLGIPGVPIDPSHAPREKRFLIFDRSENHTTYFFSPSFCSPQNLVIAPEDEKAAARADEPSNLLFKEKWDENDLNDGEDEILDESEEINALLYSDSDYDGGGGGDENNDEVTSTAHIPLKIEDGHDKEKLYDGLVEEVASCGGSPKRLRLLDGGHKKSSSPLVKFESWVNEAISSCNHENDIDLSKRDKKVKIRKTYKILENLVPGLKTNEDPVTIIEKAIAYLESMKIEAKALGLASTESEIAALP